MRYILTGVETRNKGAELMLYAILKQIELHDPQAEVFVKNHAIAQGLDYIETNVKLKHNPYKRIVDIAELLHIPGILSRLGLSSIWFTDAVPVCNIDYLIDASGFWFTDQWNLPDSEREVWIRILQKYHHQGAKIIFLPQAFGPIELSNTKRIVEAIGRYAQLIMPRESISHQYLIDAGIPAQKLMTYPDFTCLVNGKNLDKYAHLANGVCIIPNMRMIDKGTVSLDRYLSILHLIVDIANETDRKVFLLNHEGSSDGKIINLCADQLNGSVEVVNHENALVVKGIISNSYLCISSRFHGVASALNSGVPCLATSWSHKYSALFDDFNQTGCVLDLNDLDMLSAVVRQYLTPEYNNLIRSSLQSMIPSLRNKSTEMWEMVWKA